MVHRLQNRNVGYSNNVTNVLANNQATLNATEGATALDLSLNDNLAENTNIINNNIQQKKEDTLHEQSHDTSFDNISMENANYLQNTQENNSESTSDIKDEMPNFEVESIELATPQLFENEFNTEVNQEDLNQASPSVFDKVANGKSTETQNKTEIVKEPEMFDEPGLEEDFEIPAFLRKQKN